MKRRFWGAVILGLVASACQSPTADFHQKPAGVTIALGLPSRTIAPYWQEKVSDIEVTLSDPTQEHPEHTIVLTAVDTAAHFSGVEAGTWTVTVLALNGASTVGVGNGSVTVTPAGVGSATVTVSGTQNGTGGYMFQFSVPQATGVDAVLAQLYNSAGEAVGGAMMPSRVASDEDWLWTVAQAPIASGYYRLELIFSRAGVIVGRFSEAVNVWDNVTSDRWLGPSGDFSATRRFDSAEFSSSNADLASLMIRDGEGTAVVLSPGFTSALTSYTLVGQSIYASMLSLTVVPSVEGQSIKFFTYNYQTGPGPQIPLTSGVPSSTVSITGSALLYISVTAPNRTTNKVYSVGFTPLSSVVYDANGAQGGTVPLDHRGYQSGSVATVLGNTGNLTKTGQTFYGWNTASDGTGTTYLAGQPLTVSGPVSLYALWVDATFSVTNGVITGTTIAPVGALVIPEGVIGIGPGAFQDRIAITSVDLPDSLETIGANAFLGCISLNTTVVIPSGVTSLGEAAFFECQSLPAVSFESPSSLVAIGSNAFSGCYQLATVDLPPSVTVISDSAFMNCSALSSINLNQVTTIGASAFANCAQLTNVDLSQVTSLGSFAFGYSGLGAVTIPNTVTSLPSMLFYECDFLTTVVLPATLTEISTSAFENCSALTSINLPEGLMTIGDNAFKLANLTSITIPANVNSLGFGAFLQSSVQTVVFAPDSWLMSIGSQAFWNCNNLTTIELPANVLIIGYEAFRSCDGLTVVRSNAAYPPLLGTNVFAESPLSQILVPASAVAEYQTNSDSGWVPFASIIASQ